jgi:hypothetical protein
MKRFFLTIILSLALINGSSATSPTYDEELHAVMKVCEPLFDSYDQLADDKIQDYFYRLTTLLFEKKEYFAKTVLASAGEDPNSVHPIFFQRNFIAKLTLGKNNLKTINVLDRGAFNSLLKEYKITRYDRYIQNRSA